MVNDLPTEIQEEIKCLLEQGDFINAKVMYDAWTHRYYRTT